MEIIGVVEVFVVLARIVRARCKTSGGMRQAAQVAQEARSCRRLDTLDIHPQVLGHLLAEQLHTGADLDVEVPISNVLTGRLEQKKFT